MTPDMDIQENQELPATEETTQLRALLEATNIAENLSEEDLKDIGSEAKRGYESDKESRATWEDAVDQWTELAGQVMQDKSFPWPGASNVKYPLLTTAAMQFAARAYPSLLPSNGKIVVSKVIGKDPTGSKYELGQRVSTFMSYQLMHEMTGWEEGMDKLLIMLPVVGTIFKKTYWDSITKQPKSEVILPKDLVVNYWTKSLETTERISQYIEMSPRVLKERQLSKVFLDKDLGDPTAIAGNDVPALDETSPYKIIEQHTYLDLDDDGYKEPYIVTFHLDSGCVLRITARYDEQSIIFNDDGDIAQIKPIEYFTKFGFIPNPDGSFYDLGFGTLLGPINEAVNTLINQLIDAGTLNSLQGGFLGKGLRLRMGEQAFKPGEWKAVNATGDDLRKQIIPLPTKEPSSALFQLMGSLITSGKELASVAEIFTGKMPGQNTPATTTMASIEQGMKVFTAVYKRIYRSLSEEFLLLYHINKTYLNPETYSAIAGVSVGPDDFDYKSYQICPGADPTAVSQTEKLLKAQGLMELLPSGMLNPVEVIKRMLEAQEQPNAEALMNPQVLETGQPPEPVPDPKLQEIEMKSQAEQAKIALMGQAQEHKAQVETASAQAQMAMKAEQHAQDMQHSAQMNNLKAAEALHKQRIFSATSQADINQKLVNRQAEHQQKMQQQKQLPKGKNTK